MKANILFIDGIRDDSKVSIVSITQDDISYNVGGSCNLFNHINSEYFNKHILILDANETTNLNIDFNNVHLIVNQISEYDTHKSVLAKVDVLENQIPIPFINSAKNIVKTTRDSIYKLLNNYEKLIIPKTVRIKPSHPKDIINTIEKEEFIFPILLRECGNHGGFRTVLIKNSEELKDMYVLALDGREYYMTQYLECKENDIYKKYRLAVVNGEVFIRHVLFYNDWMVHSESRNFMDKNPKYYDLESAIFEKFDDEIKPKIKDSIDFIYKKLDLDYFGIDCLIDKDMNITIFEINANMNILLNTNKNTEKQTNRIIKAVTDLIINKKRD